MATKNAPQHTSGPLPVLLDAKGVAACLGVSPRTVIDLAAQGQIKGTRFTSGRGGRFRWRFRPSDVEAFLDANAPVAAAR